MCWRSAQSGPAGCMGGWIASLNRLKYFVIYSGRMPCFDALVHPPGQLDGNPKTAWNFPWYKTEEWHSLEGAIRMKTVHYTNLGKFFSTTRAYSTGPTQLIKIFNGISRIHILTITLDILSWYSYNDILFSNYNLIFICWYPYLIFIF